MTGPSTPFIRKQKDDLSKEELYFEEVIRAFLEKETQRRPSGRPVTP